MFWRADSRAFFLLVPRLFLLRHRLCVAILLFEGPLGLSRQPVLLEARHGKRELDRASSSLSFRRS